MSIQTQVLIIGGGATGTGLARDLSLRGVPCLLAEQRDIASGASGGNHGLLHSGGRYVRSDPETARECVRESAVLKRVAPHCIDDSGGLFVAVQGDDEAFIADFPALCDRAGVEWRSVDVRQARDMEPALADTLVAAYAVPDAAVDPFLLAFDNLAHAVALGARVMRNARVHALRRRNGRIIAVTLRDETTGQDLEVEARVVVNASGAWAGMVASLAGVEIPLLYSSGTLAVTQDRMARRVINRLRPASDADILVPAGTVSVLGTTSVRIASPDACRPTVGEVDAMIDDASAMLPELNRTRFIRAYAGVRPLVGPSDADDDRGVSRGFALLDHAAQGVENFITITGGKLTTYRLMAEKTADLVCAKLGLDAPCRTQSEPLPPSAGVRFLEPGQGPRSWLHEPEPGDQVLCECEMISASMVDRIVEAAGDMLGRSTLTAVSRRSRVGKGPCQGAFCGPRITAHLYANSLLSGHGGLAELKAFIERRWRGQAPVLWGTQLMQADLQEAVHCAMMELDLFQPDPTDGGHGRA